MNNSPRLNQQLIDLQQEIDAASLKLKEMRQVLILETRVEEKLRLDHHIESTEKILDQLTQRYDELEEKLEEIGLKELPDAAKNPYKSLAAFQEEDAEQFFGRETFVKLLIEKYQQVNLLPLLGPSGSGKSSVARAGLIPELKKRDIRLKILILTPTDRPLENLANHLARLITQDPFPIAKTKEFEDFLLKEKDALRRIVSSYISATNQTLVILIDQFEEIYTLCKEKTLQTAFIENILTLNEEQHLSAKIVLTLRSDFLGETQQHSKLNQLLAKDSVIVPAMNENELRDAIAQPSELAGHSLDEATINLLLEQTEGRASALPLLQFALTQIWDNMSMGVSAAQTLASCGGVGGALATKAQEIFEQLTEEDQKVTRRIFLKLVQLGEGTKDSRRRTPLSEMIAQHDESAEKVKLILERFAHKNVRLVSLSMQAIENNDIFAEITHEALMDNWQHLQEWLKDGREAERFHRRVHESAQLWQLNQRPIGSLWRSPDLDLLATFYASHSQDMTALEIDFFNSSREQQQREINEKLKQQPRLKLLTSVALIIAIIAGFFYFQAEEQKEIALQNENKANEQKKIANQQRDLALKAVNTLTYGNIEKLLNIAGTRQYILPIFEKNIQTLDAIYALEPDQNKAQREKGVNLDQMGDMWLILGDTQKALQAYQQGLQIREKLATADPLNSQSQRDLSVSFNKLGDVQLRLGQTEQALQAYQQGLQIREKLAAADPQNSEAQRDLSVSFNNLGDVQLRLGQTDQALQAYQNDLEITKKLAAADPQNSEAQRDLSVSYERLGDVQLRLGQTDQALQAYQQGLQIREKLAAADPLNSQSQRDLSISYEKLGDVQLRLGQTEQALQSHQKAHEITEKLAAADPLNSQSQRDLSISYSKIAEVYLKMKQLNEALESYQKALNITEKLLEKDPQNQKLKDDIGYYQQKIADIKKQLETPQEKPDSTH